MAAVVLRLGSAPRAAAEVTDPPEAAPPAGAGFAGGPYRPGPGKPILPLVPHGGSAVLLTESPGGAVASAFLLDVQNTGPDPLAVIPTVLGIAALDKADAPAVRQMVPRPARASGAAVASPQAGGAVDISGLAPAAIGIPLAGVDAPGIYEIETELADRDHRFASTTVKTIIYRRGSWLWAALWIAFGAVIAFGARLYIDGGGARLNLRRRIALLLQQVQAVRERAQGDAVIAASRALELDVDDRRRYARWGGSVDDIKVAIDRAELRLALLGDIIEAAATLERLEPSRQPAVRKVLDDALALVRVDPGSEAALKAKRAEVSQLGLIAAWRDQLVADLALLDDQIAIRLPAAPPTFSAALRSLGGELALARDDLASDRLDAASDRLDGLRPQLLAASADQLAQLVTADPPGIEAAVWHQAAHAIEAALADARDLAQPWAARWAAFKTAQDGYITTAVTGLTALAKQVAASDAEHAARMTEIAAELDAARKDPATAAAIYDARRLEIELVRAPVMRGVAPAPAVARTKMWLPLSLGGSVAKPDAVSARQVAMLDREVTWTSWMVNGAILAIAVASGVKALWLDDLAWGAHGAALTAFLWGAGVQTAGNVFAGLAALRTRLGAAG